MKNLNLNTKNSISVLKDPFKKNKITRISLNYSQVMFEKYFSWRAKISFSNGNTSGEQKFEVSDKESETPYEDITKQIQEFINSL